MTGRTMMLAGGMAVVLAGTPAAAQTGPLTRGAGVMSCGAYTNANAAERALAFSWVLGHLGRGAGEAAVRAKLDLLRQSDAGGLEAWIDNYCRQHPLTLLQGAAYALEVELTKTAPPLKP